MTRSSLITQAELAEFAAALKKHRWRREDFELEEDVFDPAKAEVESAEGEVGVRCLKTEASALYRLGPGFAWSADFAADLARARDLKEYLEIQTRYAQKQMQDYARQAQDLGRMMTDAAQKAKP